MPWKIAAVGQPSFTFRQFFDAVVKLQCTTSNHDWCLLSQVFIGKAKETLDSVDQELIISEVVPIFGPFIKYTIEQEEEVGSYSFIHACVHAMSWPFLLYTGYCSAKCWKECI